MAESDATITKKSGYWIVTWTDVPAANTFAAVSLGGFVDKSVQVSGTFNGATILLKGSNDGSNYIGLTDPQGNAISFAAAGLEQVSEATKWIQPTHSGGGGSESVTVTVFAIKPRK